MSDIKKRNPVERLTIANTLIQSVIADFPTQSNVPNTLAEIIRCKNCKYFETDWESSSWGEGDHYCSYTDSVWSSDEYCSRAERRREEVRGMSDKIRIGGMTIDAQSDLEYSSRQVRWLVDVAFENGKRAGRKEVYEAAEIRYKDGYNNGYADASQDLQDFKDILLKILGKGWE